MNKILSAIILGHFLAALSHASKPVLDKQAIDVVSPFTTETSRLIPKHSRPYKPQNTNPEDYNSDTDDPFRTNFQVAEYYDPNENPEPQIVIYPTAESNPNYVPPTCKEKCCLVVLGASLSIATTGTIIGILWLIVHG